MFKRIYVLVCFLSLVLVVHSYGQPIVGSNINEIYSIVQAHDELGQADNQTLVVFDIDDTLTANVEALVHVIVFEHGLEHFYEHDHAFITRLRHNAKKIFEAKKSNDPEYTQRLFSLIMEKEHFEPVEHAMVQVVKALQQHGVKVIALTNFNTGKWGLLEHIEQWRASKLKEAGFDFSTSFGSGQIFFDMLSPRNGTYPLFYEGILFTALACDKGKLLRTFLQSIGWIPKRVLYFDDREDGVYIQSVQHEMKSAAIPCTCFWYRAMKDRKERIDQAVVQFQFDYLFKHEIFLTDQEARAMMVGAKDSSIEQLKMLPQA